MKRKIAICGLLLAAVLIAVYATQMEPHNFGRSRCPSCHVTDGAGNVSRELTGPVTLLCKDCHEKIFNEGYMHPVNVVPQRVSVPADMPLSKYGQITCSTCHDIHAAYLTFYGTSSFYLRRGEQGRDFCRICHRNSASIAAGHTGNLGEAHFLSQYVVTDPSEDIDAMSKNCISCHDGSYATSVTIKVGNWSHQDALMSEDMGTHPIGVDYESARLRLGRKSDLIPIDMVDRRIRFFNGKIGCGSCHDPFSTIEKRLVMSDQGSRLCFSCHLMERGFNG